MTFCWIMLLWPRFWPTTLMPALSRERVADRVARRLLRIVARAHLDGVARDARVEDRRVHGDIAERHAVVDRSRAAGAVRGHAAERRFCPAADGVVGAVRVVAVVDRGRAAAVDGRRKPARRRTVVPRVVAVVDRRDAAAVRRRALVIGVRLAVVGQCPTSSSRRCRHRSPPRRRKRRQRRKPSSFRCCSSRCCRCCSASR